MASNYTENYGLCQWDATDQVLREEFNQDHAKIDTALGDLKANVVQTAVGSYVGNGQCGSSAPNRLEFEFVPKLVILVANKTNVLKCGTVLITGQTSSSGIGTSYSSNSSLGLILTWEGNGLSWYTGNAERQLNEEGTTYFYFALG